MSELSDFGLFLLILAGGFSLALVAIRLTARFPVPAPALFLLGAAALSDFFPELREDVSIRTVERIAVNGSSPSFIKESDEFAHGLNERIPLLNVTPGITYYMSVLKSLASR